MSGGPFGQPSGSGSLMKADFEALVLGPARKSLRVPGRALGWVEPGCIPSRTHTLAGKTRALRSSSLPQPHWCEMSSIAALEKRVKALEDDEDFSKPSYVPPPPPAASSAGASSAEVDALRKENAKLQDLLAKERYRIKHLIRAIEAKS